ncbi:MAG TPA: hypothetical protein DDZ90_20825 [Planctomycetaceae bacterium]|nr:hypothetical protein [Gimesia sp.]HBL45830.1 hypothetical protein [Planctomycetaceae bacterium]
MEGNSSSLPFLEANAGSKFNQRQLMRAGHILPCLRRIAPVPAIMPVSFSMRLRTEFDPLFIAG